MMRVILAGLVLAIVGCGAPVTRRVSVPVPVACDVQTPVRPTMPTDVKAPGVPLDEFVAAAMAEIALREGYETELLTALEECKKPVAR